MIIGAPKEIKTEEFRVGLTPTGARELARDGHHVLIETGAGVVGSNATRVAMRLGMETVVINRDAPGLQRIDELYKGRVRTLPLSTTAWQTCPARTREHRR